MYPNLLTKKWPLHPLASPSSTCTAGSALAKNGDLGKATSVLYWKTLGASTPASLL